MNCGKNNNFLFYGVRKETSAMSETNSLPLGKKSPIVSTSCFMLQPTFEQPRSGLGKYIMQSNART